jgi:hypothetical protein
MKYTLKIVLLASIFWIISVVIFYFIFKNKKPKSIVKKKCKLDKMIYLKNILSNEDYKTIKNECTLLLPYLVPDESIAINRCHVKIESNNPIYQFFYSKQFMSYLSDIVGMNVKSFTELPIEFRYYTIGSKMNWHRDSIISRNNRGCPQLEVVFTIHNTSNSKTEWIDDETGVVHITSSLPNSIMITQGGSVMHQVTETTIGNRSILKIGYNIE